MTAKEVLIKAQLANGSIPLEDFGPLYEYGYYSIEGKVPFDKLLGEARKIMAGIKLPMNDINNLLELAEGVENG